MVISPRIKRTGFDLGRKGKGHFHSLHSIKRETVFPIINLCRGDGGKKLNMLLRGKDE